MPIESPIEANNRTYQAPIAPAVVICLDGCEPAYLDAAISAGLMPHLERIRQSGTDCLAHSVIPSFTNPNNLSIATGQPPRVHGICGNYLFDPETQEEVMMNDVRFLWVPTVFRRFQQAGAKVAIVTAKDKLRALLGAGLEFEEAGACCFSAEKSDSSTQSEHGMDKASEWLGMAQPEVYSADLSEFVFAAGVKLLEERRPDLMYLTTTDYVQHKHAPGDPDANSFYEMFDKYLGQLDEMGAVIVTTADHGMKPKHKADGSPDVIYAQEVLDGLCGKGNSRVILPITDPYVVHHGALGSFATAYLPADADTDSIIASLAAIDGMLEVVSKADAVERFDLPEDRIGDIVMISGENKVIGTSEEGHDLAALKEPLRSHGGLTEQVVPFIVNRKIDIPDEPQLRNFDAIYYSTTAASVKV
ncbi:phosphonoacetate hydrolase [Chromatiales bacterium (ex Bugula neritina AB1)]|nr:phosphonoacetate hydrolase [Chromatiales bacterium (ex Bugula neritina AB1)]